MNVSLVTAAVLLAKRRVPDHHLLVTLFTPTLGLVKAFAFGGQRSRDRFPVLDPFHTFEVTLDLEPEPNLPKLLRATLTTERALDPFRHLLAVRGLSWVARVSPPFVPEPRIWTALVSFCETVLTCPQEDLRAELAAFGLTVLRLAGWCPPPSSVRSGMSPEDALAVVADTLERYA